MLNSKENSYAMTTQPRFGALDTVEGTGAKSKRYKPWATVVKENGDVAEIMNLRVNDKDQCARVLNTTIVPVGNQTKNKMAGVLWFATVCLGVGSFILPALAIPAFCCGISAAGVMLSKGLKG